jgi:lipopolysaccharide/colanic/teichoic acid biosynthesis glycosyltransferase
VTGGTSQRRADAHGRRAYPVAKRALDLVLAAGMLLVLAPLLTLTWALVRWRLGSPVMFRQARAGRDCVPFVLTKFRTMRDAVSADGEPLPDEARMTPFGDMLRRTSIDELPSLIHVLRGEMSFVGPRPLPVSYLPLYSAEQQLRHTVPPGLTGWAQVNGRNAVDWDERFALDVWYVRNASFALDLKILLLTVKVVLSRRGVSAPGQATMSRFTGSSPRPPV